MVSKLLFMRHGERSIGEDNGETFSGLTNRGCDEMRLLNEAIAPHNVMRAFSVGNERSLGSVALALMPHITNLEITPTATRLMQQQILAIDNDLQYQTHNDSDFQSELDAAFFAHKCLRFHVDQSDSFLKYSSEPPSTYSTMASVAANQILHHPNSLVCAREFFYPSLRAKLTDLKLGEKERNHYVDYYCSEVEWNQDARTQAQAVAEKGGFYELTDEYGQLEFSASDLLKLRRYSL